jgi:iron complex transport system substrate-binding protein
LHDDFFFEPLPFALVMSAWQDERNPVVRICSLLPSATEIVFALGAGDSLVGVTHECDYPREAAQIPKVTRSNIPDGLSSSQIDSAVRGALEAEGTLYELNLPLLEELHPDLILTQRLCDVCAVSYDRVQEAVKSLPSHPAVLNLEPHSLNDILETILTVGKAIGRSAASYTLVESLQNRINTVRDKTKALRDRPSVFCMEWIDPPYCAGHWMKELVEIAGGRDDLARLHQPSSRIEWSRVVAYAPEIIVLACCGLNLQRSLEVGATLAEYEGISDLPAVKAGGVYATDGSAYFSRPGPRIIESLEILAHLIHPQLFAPPPLQDAFRSLKLTPALHINQKT